MFGLKNEEILTCLLLIVVGYFIAKMFSKRCNGFSVGGQGNESSNLFPFDKKYIDLRAKNICGYGYVKHLPHDKYSECNKDDGSLDASQECVCRKGNKVIKNNKNDPNLCMPANSDGSGRGTSYCYDKTDLQNIKDFFTGIVQTI